ncbi:unnamed protein product [Trifolium pratense]|uniref:Uncharacterized protein n=1 Tax=Trifolium pratense TaxID=57577 RepID=A0ACB0II56_TRIPR|nr:unnamed protein product [Trifolium pratense]
MLHRCDTDFNKSTDASHIDSVLAQSSPAAIDNGNFEQGNVPQPDILPPPQGIFEQEQGNVQENDILPVPQGNFEQENVPPPHGNFEQHENEILPAVPQGNVSPVIVAPHVRGTIVGQNRRRRRRRRRKPLYIDSVYEITKPNEI